MVTKTEKPFVKGREQTSPNDEANSWNPDRVLDALMNNNDEVEQDWVEKGLPELVDEMVANYEKFGGMDHLTGRDLPSVEVVVEVLDDLFTILFPGYLRQRRNHQSQH